MIMIATAANNSDSQYFRWWWPEVDWFEQIVVF